MSQNNTEQSIVSAKANVMIYDDLNKKWNPSGNSPGLSKVQIYQHILNQTYRVVGRKLQDHEVVINCLLAKNLKYNQANQTFLQWRDSKQVYGLHFQSKEEADLFTQTLKMAVDNLNRLAISSASSTSSASSSSSSGNVNNSNNGDNISIGKRSIASAGSSSDYSQSIYEDNENLNLRQSYMINNNSNGGSGGCGVLNNLNNNNQNGVYNRIPHQQITSPQLSTSSSSSSSSSNGSLTISVNNPHQNGYRSSTDNYNYQPVPQQTYIQQQQQQQQTPLYQSSPIPPPPPPPPPPPMFNLIPNQQDYSQKIYDTIPDNTGLSGPTPPPPPPLPNGLFNGTNSNHQTGSNSVPQPPPPPPPPAALNSNQNSLNTLNTQPTSYINEIAKFQANKLKKVNENISETTNGVNNINNNNNNNKSSGAMNGQLDFLTEIRQRLEKKNSLNKDQEEQETTKSSATSQQKLNGVINGRKNSYGANNLNNINNTTNNNNKTQNSVNQTNQQSLSIDSPKTIKKITSTPNVVNNSNGVYSNGVEQSGLNYDKLKQELIVEFRKELQTFKQDIINSILNELRR